MAPLLVANGGRFCYALRRRRAKPKPIRAEPRSAKDAGSGIEVVVVVLVCSAEMLTDQEAVEELVHTVPLPMHEPLADQAPAHAVGSNPAAVTVPVMLSVRKSVPRTPVKLNGVRTTLLTPVNEKVNPS